MTKSPIVRHHAYARQKERYPNIPFYDNVYPTAAPPKASQQLQATHDQYLEKHGPISAEEEDEYAADLFNLMTNLSLNRAPDDPARWRTTKMGANEELMHSLTHIIKTIRQVPPISVSPPKQDRPPKTLAWEEAFVIHKLPTLAPDEAYSLPQDIRQHIQSRIRNTHTPVGQANALDIQHAYEDLKEIYRRPHTVRTPTTTDEFITTLRRTHQRWYSHRSQLYPGQWKPIETYNQTCLLVPPPQVEATLRAGWQAAQTIATAHERGFALTYLITQTGPFLHGSEPVAQFIGNNERSVSNLQRNPTDDGSATK